MIRNLALAVAAVAALGTASLATSTEAAAGHKGWHKGGGIHISFGPAYGYHYGWRHRLPRHVVRAYYRCLRLQDMGYRIACRL